MVRCVRRGHLSPVRHHPSRSLAQAEGSRESFLARRCECGRAPGRSHGDAAAWCRTRCSWSSAHTESPRRRHRDGQPLRARALPRRRTFGPSYESCLSRPVRCRSAHRLRWAVPAHPVLPADLCGAAPVGHGACGEERTRGRPGIARDRRGTGGPDRLPGDGHSDEETITASFEIAQHRNDRSLEATIAAAADALYRAKEGGRNRVEV